MMQGKLLYQVILAVFSIAHLALPSGGLAQSASTCVPPEGSLLRVVNVALDDTLNVRQGVGTDFAVLDTLKPGSVSTRFTGVYSIRNATCAQLCDQSPYGSKAYDEFYQTCLAPGRIWYQVGTAGGVTGWASAKFLEVERLPELAIDPIAMDLKGRILGNVVILEGWALNNVLAPQVSYISELRSVVSGGAVVSVEELQEYFERSTLLLISLGLSKLECSLQNVGVCNELEVCQRATVQDGGQRRWALQTQPTYVAIAEKAGFTCNVAAVEPFSQDMAVRYLNDLVAYIGSHSNEFDLTFAERFNAVRPILVGDWSTQLGSEFEVFLIFSQQYEGFRTHWENLELGRAKEESVRLEALRNELSTKLAALNQWALLNIVDPKAADIAILARSATELEYQSNEKISYLLDQANTIMIATGIGQQLASEDIEALTDQLFNPYTIYIMANISASAEHMYIDISGKPSLYQEAGVYCLISQFGEIEEYLIEKSFLENFENVSFSKSSCSETIDLIVTAGADLNSNSFVNTFSLSSTITVDEISSDKMQSSISELDMTSTMIGRDVRDGARLGYGIIQFDENNDQVCGLVSEASEAHARILVGDTSLLRIYGINVSDFKVVEDTLEDVFRAMQRNQCGAIYSSAANLDNLFLAGQNAGFTTSFLPLWVSERQVSEMFETVQAEQQERNAAQQNLESNLRLEVEALRAAQQEAEVQQALLREQYDLSFTAVNEKILDIIDQAIQFSQNVPISSADYDSQYLELRSIDPTTQRSLFHQIMIDLQSLSDRQWEISRIDLARKDYGTALFNRRLVEAVVSELQIQMRNPIVGQFDTYCKQISLLRDDVFDMWREVLISECDDLETHRIWRDRTGFESRWIVNAKY